MERIFNKIHHVCIAVNDLSKAVAYYESIGVGPWLDYPPLTDYTTLEVPNKDGFLANKYKYCNLENIQLQLLEPGPNTPQSKFLEVKGEGVYQLGFEVDDASAADKTAEDLKLKPIMRGRRDDGSGFSYLDTPDAGVVLLFRQTQK